MKTRQFLLTTLIVSGFILFGFACSKDSGGPGSSSSGYSFEGTNFKFTGADYFSPAKNELYLFLRCSNNYECDVKFSFRGPAETTLAEIPVGTFTFIKNEYSPSSIILFNGDLGASTMEKNSTISISKNGNKYSIDFTAIVGGKNIKGSYNGTANSF